MRIVWAALLLGAFGVSARADSITYVMDNVYSGSGTPSGAPKVTIDDGGTSGSVKFTFDATGLDSPFEKIDKWYFNTAFNIAGGTVTGFTNLSGFVSFPSFPYSFNNTTGSFKAGGDGYFDLIVNFANSGSGTFKDDEIFSFHVNKPGITASTFDAWSIPSGSGKGPFQSAVHLQGVGPCGDESVWLSATVRSPVSEPALALLGLVAVAAVVFYRSASARRARAAHARAS
jgi:hypothetical protein